ncbi:UDP-N-acetylmuramate--L-alanine ligase [Patescibacteria group bacterium]|nr:UDP-N-acetylmuramate--L-alanine ligase [Patescibacteria group bacterium]
MKIHFIGIGGIGVSALAQYYLAKGHEISGSDLVSSEITELLESKGVKIENISEDVEMVIYSPAVQKDNPEYIEAEKRGLKLLSYPEGLGELTKEYFTIAISGTHGKSTTCAMLSLILIKAGLDPTVIIGTKLKELGNTNFRAGKSKYLVIEACEWNASFLNYYPAIIELTNIEEEHLDYFRDLGHILETYSKYIDRLDNGTLVVNEDDINIQNVLKSKFQISNTKSNPKFKIQKYSIRQKESEKLRSILKIPGEHNVYNALGALTIARDLGVSDDIIYEVLSEFRGSWRRFEVIEEKLDRKDFTLVNDYGHHPTEVRATLKAIKEKYPDKKIWAIFQPHQYQRTYSLFNDFVKALSETELDKLIITDIYDVAGREKTEIKEKVSSEKLVEAINKPWVKYLAQDKVKEYIQEKITGKEVILVMGAGDVYNILE